MICLIEVYTTISAKRYEHVLHELTDEDVEKLKIVANAVNEVEKSHSYNWFINSESDFFTPHDLYIKSKLLSEELYNWFCTLLPIPYDEVDEIVAIQILTVEKVTYTVDEYKIVDSLYIDEEYTRPTVREQLYDIVGKLL